MNILIMGGTQFLGRHITQTALNNGHTVTLFNRGKTNQDLFPTVTKLKGDRAAGDLTALEGTSWDAVIDVSAYYPRAVRELLETVETQHFTLISTISTYASEATLNQDETAPLSDPITDTEEITGATYGGLKVACENVCHALAADKTLFVRSGLIAGPDDHTDRFSYWPWRAAQGGWMIAAGDPSTAFQIVDVRDEAEWILRQIEAQATGAFNVTGKPILLEKIIETTAELTNQDTRPLWLSHADCEAHDIRPWVDLPLWVPGDATKGLHTFNIDKALAAGLTFRPLETTIADTLAYLNNRPDSKLVTGLDPEKERQVLAKLL